jgi:hypothetical protein
VHCGTGTRWGAVVLGLLPAYQYLKPCPGFEWFGNNKNVAKESDVAHEKRMIPCPGRFVLQYKARCFRFCLGTGI